MELPRRFRTSDPEQLKADLERLSDVTRLRLELQEQAPATGELRAQAGHLQPVTGDADLYLPDVMNGLLSAEFSVQRLDAAGTVRLFPFGSQTVNGSDPLTLPAEVRIFHFRATKHGWWRE